MTSQKNSRRHVLAGMAGLLGAGSVGSRAAAAVLTPDATEGPYYPTPAMRKPDTDNDLVKIAGLVEEAGGEIFTLRGAVTDANGEPLVGYRVEIWQCDTDGNYMHPDDRGSDDFDPAFQGFGHDITDADGGYVFRTIKPVMYPGRTPHIHVKVFSEDRELLTTQFYVKGDPANARDRIFNRMSEAEAESVSMVYVDGPDGLEARVDVTL